MIQSCHHTSMLYSPDQTKIIYQLCNDICLNIQQKILVGQQYQQICFNQSISVFKFNYQKDFLFVGTHDGQRYPIEISPKIYAFKFYPNGTINKNHQIYYNILFNNSDYSYPYGWQHISMSMSFSSKNKMAVTISNILYIFNITYEKLQLNLQFQDNLNFSHTVYVSSTAFIPQNESYLLFSYQKLIIYNIQTRSYSIINDNYSYYVAASPKGQFIVQLLYTNQFRIYNYENFNKLKLNMFFSFINKTRIYQISNIIISNDQKQIAFLFLHNFLVFQVIKQNNLNYNVINLYEQQSRTSTISNNGKQLLTYNYSILSLQRWYLCPDGTYFSNQQCVNCQILCLTCMNSSEQCTSCKPDRYLQKQRCIQCDVLGCLLCYKQDQCLLCNEIGNFQKQPINNTCACQQVKQLFGSLQKCYSKISDCKIQQKDTCTSCNTEFTLKTDKTECIKDIVNCKTQVENLCNQCDSGFTLKTDKTECIKDIVNCKTQVENLCNQCDSGFTLKTDKTECIKDIVNCKTQVENLCTECDSGFILKSDKTECFKHIARCKNQTNQMCNVCLANYDLIESKCIHQNRFNFKITLGTNMALFNSKKISFVSSILTSIGQTNTDYIGLSKVLEGSVIVQGSVQSQYAPQTISYSSQYQSLVQLFSQSTIAQIPIVSFNIVKSSIVTQNLYTLQGTLKLMSFCHPNQQILYSPDQTKIIYRDCNYYCFNIQQRLLVGQTYEQICLNNKIIITVLKFNYQKDFLFVGNERGQIYGYRYINGTIDKNNLFYENFSDYRSLHPMDFSFSFDNKIAITSYNYIFIFTISYQTFRLTIFDQPPGIDSLITSIAFIPNNQSYLLIGSESLKIYNILTRTYYLINLNSSYGTVSPNGSFIFQFSSTNQFNIYKYEDLGKLKLLNSFSFTSDTNINKIIISDDQKYIFLLFPYTILVLKIIKQNQNYNIIYLYEQYISGIHTQPRKYSATFMNDGSQLIFSQQDSGLFQRWNLCPDGTYLLNQQCLNCSSSCKTCHKSSERCTSCKQKQYLQNQACFQCNLNLQGCSLCYSSNQCLQCNETLFFQKEPINKTCVCQQGKQLFGSLQKCYSKINDCKIQQKDTCTSCNTEFILKTDKTECIKDIVNCKTQVENLCNQCDSGFTLKTDKTECIKDIVNCKTQVENLCTECDSGFTLKTDKTECIKDIVNCKTQVENLCNQCDSGFTLKTDKTECIKDIVNCKTQVENLCTECDSGFILKSDKTECFKHIARCKNQTNQMCNVCLANYDLIESKCIHQNRFNFKITLGTNMALFNSKKISFVSSILTSIGQTNTDYIGLSKVLEGSVIVQGSVQSQYAPQTISYSSQYQSLVQLFSQSTIAQIPIVSFNVVKSSIVSNTIQNSLSQSLVVFLTLGLFSNFILYLIILVILLIISIIIYKCKTRSIDQQIEKIEKQINENKLKNYQKNNKEIKQMSRSQTDQYSSEKMENNQQI